MRRFGRLPLLLLVGLVGLVVAACAAGPQAEPAPQIGSFTGGPRLAFDQKAYDFGPVPFNREVKATYQMKNVGDQPLLLRKVSIKTVEGC